VSHFRKTARFIIPIFLVVVICFITNTTINQHFHKLPSGLVIVHAHPFNKENDGKPFQEHHHTSSELIILDQMFNTVFWIYLFTIFLAPLLFVYKIANYPLVITFKNPDLYFLRNYHAPPETSY
jgi:hypothetical protein